MPQTNVNPHTSSPSDDLGSTDEIKVFKDEGEREDETISSENLLEEKSSLIDLTESEEKTVKSTALNPSMPCIDYGKLEQLPAAINMGYIVSPYPYTNGVTSTLPVSIANKMVISPFFCHSGDHLTTPPPAHCGIPAYQLDPKGIGLTRPALYAFPGGQYPYPILNSDISQVASWHSSSMYSAVSSLRNPYPPTSDFYRFSPTILSSAHSHAMNSPTSPVVSKHEDNMSNSNIMKYETANEHKNISCDKKDNSIIDKKKFHIKKPLNAFMLYMKEMRAKVVAECTLKESAAINQILGRKWHSLSRDEQSVYYDKARQERQLHMELYPGWTARDNYGYGSKKKKRKKDRSPAESGGSNMKKCRARYGLDQQNQWCKPCRRKKKCMRYKETDNFDGPHASDDNIGSPGSLESHTLDEDNELSYNPLSSPGSVSVASTRLSPARLSTPSIPNCVYTSDYCDKNKEKLISNVSNRSTNDFVRDNIVENNSDSIDGNNNEESSENTPDTPANVSNVTNDGNNEKNENFANINMMMDKHNKFTDAYFNNDTFKNYYHNRILNPFSAAINESFTSSSKAQMFGVMSHDNALVSPCTSAAMRTDTAKINTSVKNLQMYLDNGNTSAQHSESTMVKYPVGANPRDSNNPLSINQLTKRNCLSPNLSKLHQYHDPNYLYMKNHHQNINSQISHTYCDTEQMNAAVVSSAIVAAATVLTVSPTLTKLSPKNGASKKNTKKSCSSL